MSAKSLQIFGHIIFDVVHKSQNLAIKCQILILEKPVEITLLLFCKEWLFIWDYV
jgi:hypothetical protein